MKTEHYQRLLPFLKDKRARQRVILYLIADGFTVGELVAMTVRELRAIELPVELMVMRDEVLNGHKTGFAFITSHGKQLLHTSYYRLVRITAEKVLGRPMSQETFRAYIQSAKRSTK